MELGTLGIRRQLTSPQLDVRRAALDRALGLVHKRPQLALAVLTGNLGYQEKREAADRVRANMDYPPVRYETSAAIASLASMVSLPPFFRLLAKQPPETVRTVHQLWGQGQDLGCGRGLDRSAPGPIGFIGTLERHLSAISPTGFGKFYEETVAVTPRTAQTIVGYHIKLAMADGKVTDHTLFFTSGCQIDGLAFEYQFRPQRSLGARITEGFWDQLL